MAARTTITIICVVSRLLVLRHIIPLKNEDGGQEFPGGPVVTTQRCHCCGPSSTPARGTENPQATRLGQKERVRIWMAVTSEGEGGDGSQVRLGDVFYLAGRLDLFGHNQTETYFAHI